MGELHAGRYELVDHIGGGGAGQVWRAWDHRTRRYLAVKVLKQRDAGALMRFVREQSLRVAHPHVLPPTGFAADDDTVLLTMDLVSGGSMSAFVAAAGPVPVEYAVVLLDQLLDALTAVHAADVVHRDVKPANLLLDAVGNRRPVLRLADFGIAVVGGDPRLTELGLLVGTPAYLPPELATGVGPEPRHDLYAAGGVAFFLLTAAHPRMGVPLDPGVLPPSVPPALRAVFAQLVAADPDQRFPTAVAARMALAEAVATDGLAGRVAAVGTPVATSTIGIPPRVGPLPPGWGPAGPDVGPTSGGPLPGAVAGGRGAYEWQPEAMSRAAGEHASTAALPAEGQPIAPGWEDAPTYRLPPGPGPAGDNPALTPRDPWAPPSVVGPPRRVAQPSPSGPPGSPGQSGPPGSGRSGWPGSPGQSGPPGRSGPPAGPPLNPATGRPLPQNPTTWAPPTHRPPGVPPPGRPPGAARKLPVASIAGALALVAIALVLFGLALFR